MAEDMQEPPNFQSSHEETEMEITEVELDEENMARLRAEEEQRERDVEEQPETATSSNSAPCLFVGGLSSKTTEDELQKHFAQYGTPSDVEIAKKMGKGGGELKSRRFGFVTMATVSETEAVLKDSHVINDKILTVRISKPPDATERKLRLCVSNIDVENTTEDSLRAHFVQFGTVTSCLLSKELVDGKTVSRGTAFVNMANEEGMKAVLANNEDGQQLIDGRMAKVRRIAREAEHYEQLRRLWIGGLDKEKTTESDLKEYFNKFGSVRDCVIIRESSETEGEDAKSKGYGFISMGSVVDIGAILKHNGPHVIHDRELVFNRAPLIRSRLVTELHLTKQIVVSDLREANLSIDVLKAYFSSHAKVRHITVDDREGTATVALYSNDDVEKLAQMRDHFIKKHWVTVNRADPQVKPIPKQSGYSNKELKRARYRQNFQQRGFNKQAGRGQFGSIVGRSVSFDSADDGFGSSGQYFYDERPSNYGPVRGMGPNFSGGGFGGRGRGTGGWVYVENLYDDPNMYRQQGRRGKGFKGKGYGYGDGASGLGWGYGDSWGMGGSNSGGGWSY